MSRRGRRATSGEGPEDAAARRLRRWLGAAGAQLSEDALARVMLALSVPERTTCDEHWPLWRHRGQEEPASDGFGRDWRVWLMMAGRGFGKTRAGAEWTSARARAMPGARIALIGASVEEVVKVMVEGQSGLIAVAATGETPEWRAAKRELAWPNGATAFAYSGERPEKLRGPEHHFAWCDELAKWGKPQASWDNLMLGLRLGEAPRTLVTTTPRPVAALKAIIGLERTVVTRGRTRDNPYLCAEYKETMALMYGGTRLGRQELDGHLFEDVAGALWSRELIEACRTAPARGRAGMARVVIGVDPPASADGDACGIVACGADASGTCHVLGDHSADGLSPGGWAAKVAAAAESWGADRVVAEANNGGAMVEAVLRNACAAMPVTLVHASDGKSARAEPAATAFEAGRVKIAGRFPALEDQLCGMTIGGLYAGPGRSPDRADAMVWALAELLRGAGPAPAIRLL